MLTIRLTISPTGLGLLVFSRGPREGSPLSSSSQHGGKVMRAMKLNEGRWKILLSRKAAPAGDQTCNPGDVSQRWWEDWDCCNMLDDANAPSPPVFDASHDNHPCQPCNAATLASHFHLPFCFYFVYKNKFALPGAIFILYYDSFPPGYSHNYSHPKIMLMV